MMLRGTAYPPFDPLLKRDGVVGPMVLDRVSDGLLAVGGGFGGSFGSKTSYILSVSRAIAEE